ncbi:MAG: glycosyltransferase, partial [Pontimonas sp.]|nr:glycosyltransferase [Pontimonas sp.]
MATTKKSGRPAREADAWVVIPLFNESEVISSVVTELCQSFEHVVCVDDGSSDTSAELATKAGARVLRHPINLGQGAA